MRKISIPQESQKGNKKPFYVSMLQHTTFSKLYYTSLFKNFQAELNVLISFSFFSLLQPFNCFSLSIASFMF